MHISQSECDIENNLGQSDQCMDDDEQSVSTCTDFLYFAQGVPLHCVCTAVVLSVRSIISSTVAEYSKHISNKQFPRAVVTRFKTLAHSFQI